MHTLPPAGHQFTASGNMEPVNGLSGIPIMLQVPPAIIHQYNLQQMHARMLELLARQFPNSYAIAPATERGTWGSTEPARRRKKSVAEEDYTADISAEAFEQRLFSTSALQVAGLPFHCDFREFNSLHSSALVQPSRGQ